METVKIKLNGGMMPMKATAGAAAFDLYAPEDIELKEGRQIINLKFSMEIPHGYAATIQPRSGFSAKGIEVDRIHLEDGVVLEVKKAVRVDGDVRRGLIDSDFRGNVGVILYVREKMWPFERIVVRKGTRIAQMQIVEVPEVELIEAEELTDTDRGEGGFGSTGSR